MKMKLAIVGTRNPGVSYAEWEELLFSKVNKSDVTMVVSGGAKGVDSFAKRFAARHHIPLMEFLPDYAKFALNLADTLPSDAILKSSRMQTPL